MNILHIDPGLIPQAKNRRETIEYPLLLLHALQGPAMSNKLRVNMQVSVPFRWRYSLLY